MRVLLISGTFPPDRCGVGDYTGHLAEHLARHGSMEVAVLTGAVAASTDGGDASPALFRGTAGAVSLCDARRAIRAFRPDVVHIQYPTMRPVSRWIPVFARRALGLPVVQTWHEHYSECGQLGILNLFGLQRLIYVREDAPHRLPWYVKRLAAASDPAFIPNACTIPAVRLNPDEREHARRVIGGGRPVVAYFGFAYPNKDVHLLFEIADPSVHHLLLICSLDREHSYQRRLIELVQSERWGGHVTVTGFVPAEEAGRLLASADAVVFPFSGGVGQWNTSVKAALASGTFVLGTTADPKLAGFNAERNLCLAPCGNLEAMRAALAAHLGQHRDPDTNDEWAELVREHRQIYGSVI